MDGTSDFVLSWTRLPLVARLTRMLGPKDFGGFRELIVFIVRAKKDDVCRERVIQCSSKKLGLSVSQTR